MFPTNNPLSGVWQQEWHNRKDNSHGALFFGHRDIFWLFHVQQNTRSEPWEEPGRPLNEFPMPDCHAGWEFSPYFV